MSLAVNQVRSLLHYRPDTGQFVRRIGRRGHAAGELAGSVNSKGYVVIGIDGRPRLAHRVAWLYVTGEWPDGQIDHIDGDKENNSWANLRLVDAFTNHKNKKLLKTNTSGVPGVRLKREKWEASIRPDNTYIYLGTFGDWFDAVCARKSAENRYNFHPNHGRLV